MFADSRSFTANIQHKPLLTAHPTVVHLKSAIQSSIALDSLLPPKLLQQVDTTWSPSPLAFYDDGTEVFAVLNSLGKSVCTLTLHPDGRIQVELSEAHVSTVSAPAVPAPAIFVGVPGVPALTVPAIAAPATTEPPCSSKSTSAFTLSPELTARGITLDSPLHRIALNNDGSALYELRGSDHQVVGYITCYRNGEFKFDLVPPAVSTPTKICSNRCIWCDSFQHLLPQCPLVLSAFQAGKISMNQDQRLIDTATGQELTPMYGRGGMQVLLQ